MVSRSQSQPFSEPPPLPPSSDNSRPASLIIAAAVSVLVVVALVLLFLTKPSSSTTSADGSGTGASGTGTHNGNGSGSSDGDGNAGSATSDGPSHGGSRDASIVKEGEPGNTTKSKVPSEPANKSAAHVQRDVPRTSADQSSLAKQSEEIERADPNQFFTIRSLQNEIKPETNTEPGLGSRTDAFSGRAPGRKEDMLRGQGGTHVTEAAVELGLEWLAKHQQSNGLWSLNGPYQDGSTFDNSAAASAMALLAFEGAGHTHLGSADEKFSRVVSRGSSALIKKIFGNENETEGIAQGGGYTQAMCAMAICELYGMTHDAKLRKPAFQVLQYCLDAQSPEGGWRYSPRTDTDTSITGWFVMGLQSGRMAGLKLPSQTFKNVSGYLDKASSGSNGRYSYQPGLPARPSMTAEALLCRQYLGWRREDPRLQMGAKYLLSIPPNWASGQRDVYYMYYATQVCHHMGGNYWQKWNSVMREVIPANQSKNGQERGSWEPHGDQWGTVGGRLYVTCMCLYMLEVYYRYLPLYQDAAVSPGR